LWPASRGQLWNIFGKPQSPAKDALKGLSQDGPDEAFSPLSQPVAVLAAAA